MHKTTVDSDGRKCILVLSRYALDYLPYHNNRFQDSTWETCDLRKWLNSEFYYTAFSDDERSQLMEVENNNHDASMYNKTWRAKGGEVTYDNVFLLSYEQAEQYFENYYDRKCYATDYAIWKGAYVDDQNVCYWWLRSPGGNQGAAINVLFDGKLGSRVEDSDCCVRPAMWLYVN